MYEKKLRKFYSTYFTEWLLEIGDRNLLSLGNAFDRRISKVLSVKAQIDEEIRQLDPDVCTELFSTDTTHSGKVNRPEIIKIDQHFRKLAKTAPAEFRVNRNLDFTLWALGLRPDVFADYEYWGKFDSYLVQELAWLSTGLPPHSLESETQFQKGSPLNTHPLAEISRRRKLMERAFFGGNKVKIASNDFLQWATKVGFEGHEGFQKMITISASRYQAKAQDVTTSIVANTESANIPMQPRQFQTAAKIIAAMAVDCYGYVPNQKRSKATKDILDACDRAGLTVSNDTILKFLRAADKAIQAADN